MSDTRYADPETLAELERLRAELAATNELLDKVLGHNDGDNMAAARLKFFADLLEELAALRKQIDEMRRVPDDWQLVPKEPTPEMKEAYRLATIQFDTLTHSAYRAMLAAAPEPKP